jgi:putative heme iron utilization protein
MALAGQARRLLRTQHAAVLATLGLEPLPGFPFTSAVPYCLDAGGRVVLLISRLARHTAHVKADNRVSLLVQGEGADVQAAPRLSLAGRLLPVPGEELEAVASRYARYFPHAREYHRELDFEYWRLQPEGGHFIAGFARVAWLDSADLTAATPFELSVEEGMVAHMNTDHADALPLYCRQAGIPVPHGGPPVMTGIDGDGFHLRLESRIVYIPFPRAVATPAEVRQTLVAMLTSARAGDFS